MEEEHSNSHQKLENETELVDRAKTDDQAFEILYNHYFPKIYGYLFKRTGHRQQAEDLTSMTFMKVFCNLKKYQHQGYTFGAWVYRIATNNLTDHYRKSGRKQVVDIEQVEEIEDPQPTPDAEVQASEEKSQIEFVIRKLPERYQRVINLKYFAEMSNQEVAKVLKISENNTGVLLYRALKSFQKAYKKYAK